MTNSGEYQSDFSEMVASRMGLKDCPESYYTLKKKFLFYNHNSDFHGA